MQFDTLFSDVDIESFSAFEKLEADAAAIRSLLTAGHTGAALTLFDAKRRAFQTWDSVQQVLRRRPDQAGIVLLDDSDLSELRSHWAQVCRDLKVTVLQAHREAAATHLGRHILHLWDLDTRVNGSETLRLREEETRLAQRFSAFDTPPSLDKMNHDPSNQEALIAEPVSPEGSPTRAEQTSTASTNQSQPEPPAAALFSQLLTLRSAIAQAAGYTTFRDYAYARNQRVDYGPDEVAQFREGVRNYVVPLLDASVKRQALEGDIVFPNAMAHHQALSFDEIRPAGGPQLLFDRMTGLIAEGDVDQELVTFFRSLRDAQAVQFDMQDEAAASVAVLALPGKDSAVFMQLACDGSAHDITLMAEGLGRAYQLMQGSALSQIDYLLPTAEAAGIPPKALSLFAMSNAERLLNEGAAPRYRHLQLMQILSEMTHAACLDEFEHEIYANPHWDFSQRNAAWQALCDTYLPWSYRSENLGLCSPPQWYERAPLFQNPFGALNAALSQCCALQIWLSSRIDITYATELFKSVCAQGGVYPFRTLISKLGLISPFGPDTLPEITREVELLLWA